jgi:hypothetical protein
MNISHDKLTALVCQYLDRSTQDLDAEIVARLDAVRMQALQRTAADADAVDEALLVDALLTGLEEQPLPDSVANRLDAMRAQAVDKYTAPAARPAQAQIQTWLQTWFGEKFALSASMVATACVLVTVVSLVYVREGSEGNLTLNDELTLIASAEDLELYENLDFYLWLDENGFAN